MGILDIFSSISAKPKQPPVEAIDRDVLTSDEDKFVSEVLELLDSRKAFSRDFTSARGRMQVDFQGKELDVNFYPNDGTRIRFAAVENYLGRFPWGGGIEFYSADGSFAQEPGGRYQVGVFPRKFNTAQDVFKYIINELSKGDKQSNSPIKQKVASVSSETKTKLHQPLDTLQLEFASSLSKTGKIKDPREDAKNKTDVTTLVSDTGKEYQLTRDKGFKMRGNGINIDLNASNPNHVPIITKFQQMRSEAFRKYGENILDKIAA